MMPATGITKPQVIEAPDPGRSRKMDITFTDAEFRLIRDCAAEMNITQRDLLRRLITPALDLLKHVRS